MKGWKTWTAGIGTILGGVSLILIDLSDGKFDNFAAGWTMITGGLAIIGIGHKVEKAGS